MKRLFAILLFALALPAAAFDCAPSRWVPMPGLGTPLREASTEAGDVYAWFCDLPAAADGSKKWAAQIFPVLKKHENLTLFKAAAERVAAAPDAKVAVKAELRAARVYVEPGGPDEYEYARLWNRGCLELTKPPTETFTTLPANWCGVLSAPYQHNVSPYPGATHRATYATTAAFNGTRATLTNGKVPILTNGAPTPCACTAGYVTERNAAGVTTTYCSVLGVAQQVANCSQR